MENFDFLVSILKSVNRYHCVGISYVPVAGSWNCWLVNYNSQNSKFLTIHHKSLIRCLFSFYMSCTVFCFKYLNKLCGSCSLWNSNFKLSAFKCLLGILLLVDRSKWAHPIDWMIFIVIRLHLMFLKFFKLHFLTMDNERWKGDCLEREWYKPKWVKWTKQSLNNHSAVFSW